MTLNGISGIEMDGWKRLQKLHSFGILSSLMQLRNGSCADHKTPILTQHPEKQKVTESFALAN